MQKFVGILTKKTIVFINFIFVIIYGWVLKRNNSEEKSPSFTRSQYNYQLSLWEKFPLGEGSRQNFRSIKIFASMGES
jgi:hypothetical protein